MKPKINFNISIYSLIAFIVSLIALAFIISVLVTNNSRGENISNIKQEITELRKDINSKSISKNEVLDSMTYNQLITLENKHDKFVNEIIKKNNKVEIMAWAFGSITLVGLITGLSTFLVQLFGGFNSHAKRIAEEESKKIIDQKFIADRVSDVVNDEVKDELKKHEGKIKGLYNKIEKETDEEIKNLNHLTNGLEKLKMFKENTPIILVSEDKEHSKVDETEKYLTTFGFRPEESINISEIDNHKDNDFVYFFIDTGEFGNKEFTTKIDEWSKKLKIKTKCSIFYLGVNRITPRTVFCSNFCGSLVTANQNLNDLLSYYHDFWKKE